MAQLNIRISDEDRKKLEEIAKEEDRSVSYLVRKAISEYLEKQKEN